MLPGVNVYNWKNVQQSAERNLCSVNLLTINKGQKIRQSGGQPRHSETQPQDKLNINLGSDCCAEIRMVHRYVACSRDSAVMTVTQCSKQLLYSVLSSDSL